MANLSDIFGNAIRNVDKYPTTISQNFKRHTKDIEKNIRFQRDKLASADIKEIRRNILSVIPPIKYNDTVEHGIHWYIKGDPSRRLTNLLFNRNKKVSLVNSTLEEHIYKDTTKDGNRIKKDSLVNSTLEEQIYKDTTKDGNISTDRLITLNNFFTKILQSNNSKTKLQYNHFFNIELLFTNLDTKLKEDNNIPLLCNDISIPNLTIDVEVFTNQFGHMVIPSDAILPHDHKITLSFLSTEESLHENLFFNWIKETTADKWLYKDRPFTKANIFLDFWDQEYKTQTYTYIFCDAYPTAIITSDGSYDSASVGANFNREITFAFDYMKILSKNEKIRSYDLPI